MINIINRMTRRGSLLAAYLSLSLVSQAQVVRTPAEPEAFKNIFWSLCVQDAETGERLVDIRPCHLMTPASTLKVPTTATAMEVLSPDSRLSTRICMRGKISNGVLEGDLFIIGGGDPSIGSRHLKSEDRHIFFRKAADALAAKGISVVKGDIIAYSPQSYDYQALNPRWLHYDMGNHYAAGAYLLNLFDNSYEVVFSDYGRRFVHMPTIPGLKLSGAYTYSTTRKSDSLYISMPIGDGGHRLITGVYPAAVKQLGIRGDIPNPPLFFAQYMSMYIRKRGVTHKGKCRTADTLPSTDMPLLYEHLSPTIEELARLTNIHSINLYAEALLRQTWIKKRMEEGRNPTQVALHHSLLYWQGRGLVSGEANVFDGSGLSPENKITANYLTSLLGKVYRSDSTHRFMRTLPLAGKEGTVTSFLKDTPLSGRAYLKSGSIKHVIAYAGYIQTPDGKVYAVSIMANNFTLRHAEMRKIFEGILLETFGTTLSPVSE
ncbi:D-alanyl-D-alanine carboxypeptidase/D-alanyl-D-alanine-endopeptidase [Porphyromonas sp.]|uniref:D-alanyl-D-alanine carboxypeptidase/D-alanyl-D-alanine endopeptidase n=1 Tax=Porphyromonas sp. TaxID=1924944 RepID=UPI0026DD6781|nr:D-alanyl-D-alanine carboxypeptidase/D-alanyl-D-alanine-endopeptidase [Porphyromonas sp.]MDO4771780.1 D-alanyl-D-alanine carboxypeptidase/D-alanyl-D-alanine-endopeptidase [Porphyromonas sp.]